MANYCSAVVRFFSFQKVLQTNQHRHHQLVLPSLPSVYRSLVTLSMTCSLPASNAGVPLKGQLPQRNASPFEQLPQPVTFFTSRSEEHTSELQSLMRISYAVFCLKKKKIERNNTKAKSQTIYKHIIS